MHTSVSWSVTPLQGLDCGVGLLKTSCGVVRGKGCALAGTVTCEPPLATAKAAAVHAMTSHLGTLYATLVTVMTAFRPF